MTPEEAAEVLLALPLGERMRLLGMAEIEVSGYEYDIEFTDGRRDEHGVLFDGRTHWADPTPDQRIIYCARRCELPEGFVLSRDPDAAVCPNEGCTISVKEKAA